MTCDNCGMPAQGKYCETCSAALHQESYYGVPEDHIENDDDDGGDEE